MSIFSVCVCIQSSPRAWDGSGIFECAFELKMRSLTSPSLKPRATGASWGTLQCLSPGNVAVFHFVNMQLYRLGWHFRFGEEERNVAEWVWCVWVTVTKLPVVLLWGLWARGWFIRDLCMSFQIKDKWGDLPCVEHLTLLFHLDSSAPYWIRN